MSRRRRARPGPPPRKPGSAGLTSWRNGNVGRGCKRRRGETSAPTCSARHRREPGIGWRGEPGLERLVACWEERMARRPALRKEIEEAMETWADYLRKVRGGPGG